MSDFFIVIKATIASFFSVKREVSYLLIYLTLFILIVSLFSNTFLILTRQPEPAPAYKMTQVDVRSKYVYVIALSDLYAYYEFHESPAREAKMPIFVDEMDVYGVACSMITPDMPLGELKRLTALVRYINEDGCIETTAP